MALGQTSKHIANGQRIPKDALLGSRYSHLKLRLLGAQPSHPLGIEAHLERRQAGMLSYPAFIEFLGINEANEDRGIETDFKTLGQLANAHQKTRYSVHSHGI